MILLIISIIVALLITIALPIAAGYWLNKRFGVTWRVFSYGAMGYLITQVLTTAVFVGFSFLVNRGFIIVSDRAFLTTQLVMNVVLAALFGVLVRWAGVKYLKENLNNLKSAYGIGVGYGGAESIMLVGLPLLMTFISMLLNMNIDPQTSSLDPVIISQYQGLWQVPAYIPLAGSLERIAALVMHVTVTILIFQVIKRGRFYWLAAAFGLELLVNGLVVGLAQAGLRYGWIILIAVVLMAGNIYLLHRLGAFDIHPKEVVEIIEN